MTSPRGHGHRLEASDIASRPRTSPRGHEVVITSVDEYLLALKSYRDSMASRETKSVSSFNWIAGLSWGV